MSLKKSLSIQSLDYISFGEIIYIKQYGKFYIKCYKCLKLFKQLEHDKHWEVYFDHFLKCFSISQNEEFSEDISSDNDERRMPTPGKDSNDAKKNDINDDQLIVNADDNFQVLNYSSEYDDNDEDGNQSLKTEESLNFEILDIDPELRNDVFFDDEISNDPFNAVDDDLQDNKLKSQEQNIGIKVENVDENCERPNQKTSARNKEKIKKKSICADDIKNINDLLKSSDNIKNVKKRSKKLQKKRPKKRPPSSSTKKEILYKCKICNKEIYSNYNVKRHLQVHPENPFVCNYCGKEYNNGASYKIHLKQHTSAKRFRCHICGKAFFLKTDLKAHMICHTDVRPYECELCGKSFKSISVLKSHILTVHEKRRCYVCVFCDRSYAQSTLLKDHIAKDHTGTERHKCEICSKTFFTLGGLIRHKKKLHEYKSSRVYEIVKP